ncbi:MAG: HAD-IIIC family phosphatase [Candidatus Omnitrophota bacterium]
MSLKKITLANIQDELNRDTLKQLPGLPLTVLRNITIEPLEPYLRYALSHIGFNTNIRFGAYDNILQEALKPDNPLFKETKAVLVFCYLEQLSFDLARNFCSMSESAVQEEMNRITGFFQTVIQGIRRQSPAMILWHGLEIPDNPNYGIYDSQHSPGQKETVYRLNQTLMETLQKTSNAYFVDLNTCLARIGSGQFYDLRYWHISKAPYSRDGLWEIAAENLKFLRSILGKRKKCLILDCDNVLWGGVVGEDGLENIKLDKTYPGSVYSDFQQEVLNLYHAGIIIALCSKNNEQDVWEVFKNHPGMLLKEENITTARINWEDKAGNIKSIAEELNIGLDSMVFCDDNEFEINLVNELLPDVETIHLPVHSAQNSQRTLAACGLFDTVDLTEEDRVKTHLYKAEQKRTAFKTSASSLEDYYRSLEMEIDVNRADDFSFQRIAQLTQKTNQFNMTTRRYSQEDILRFSRSKDHCVLYVKVNDKFGSSGLVGVSILEYKNDDALIDSFLLSCRILGRGIEQVFLKATLMAACQHGSRLVTAEFMPSAKNALAESFYPDNSFKPVDTGGTSKIYTCAVEQTTSEFPEYFKSVTINL